MHWDFERIDEARSGSSGDVSKLFRNEPLKSPGMLATGAPRPDATIMAREVIQNSWDAAHELRAEYAGTPPDFSVDFTFTRLRGATRDDLARKLGLDALAARARGLDAARVGLPDRSWLFARPGTPLDILVIEEHGTTGMHGPWRGAASKMYLALVSIGFTVKPSGSGGSYGYGKAGLIRGSATRTVVAYSCFRARPDDPGVTRRLLGMTYWGPHEIDGVTYSGFARYGQQGHDAAVRPFENEHADEIARSLGLAVRDPAVVDDLGTTFLVIDPTVEAVELRKAVERNWWPVIVSDPTFSVHIVDQAGRTHRARPERRQELADFLRGYALATAADVADERDEKTVTLLPATAEDRRLRLGTLGLVSDQGGWSYPSDDGIDHRSLVALIRGPRMVVEYLEAGFAKPFVRGVFVAHPDVDDLLRQTEPRGHDAWQTDVGDDATDPAAPEIARTILNRIRQNVTTFRRDIKPPVPDRRDLRLPELEKLFRLVVETEGAHHPPPPSTGPRQLAIAIADHEAVAVGDGAQVRMRASVQVRLAERYDGPPAHTRVAATCQFVEQRRGGRPAQITITAPARLRPDDEGALWGMIDHDGVELSIESVPYPRDWSLRLLVRADTDGDNASVDAAVAPR